MSFHHSSFLLSSLQIAMFRHFSRTSKTHAKQDEYCKSFSIKELQLSITRAFTHIFNLQIYIFFYCIIM